MQLISDFVKKACSSYGILSKSKQLICYSKDKYKELYDLALQMIISLIVASAKELSEKLNIPVEDAKALIEELYSDGFLVESERKGYFYSKEVFDEITKKLALKFKEVGYISIEDVTSLGFLEEDFRKFNTWGLVSKDQNYVFSREYVTQKINEIAKVYKTILLKQLSEKLNIDEDKLMIFLEETISKGDIKAKIDPIERKIIFESEMEMKLPFTVAEIPEFKYKHFIVP